MFLVFCSTLCKVKILTPKKQRVPGAFHGVAPVADGDGRLNGTVHGQSLQHVALRATAGYVSLGQIWLIILLEILACFVLGLIAKALNLGHVVDTFGDVLFLDATP